MQSIRVIQIGMGIMGKAWLKLAHEIEGIEAVAWVDSNPAALDALIQAGYIHPQHCYTSFEHAFQQESAEAVIITTPPELHPPVAVAAAQRGLHILTEKPLADSYHHALQTVEAAERSGVILMVAQNRRHNPAIHTMRKLVHQEQFGLPGQMYVTFRNIFTRNSFRDTMAHPLLIDMANHHFDTIRYVLGQEPIGVHAAGWNPRWSRFRGIASAIVVFDYASGLRVVYDGSWHSIDVAMTSNACDWRIECEHGVIACNNEIVYVGSKDNSATGTTGIELTPSDMLTLPFQYQAYLLHEFIQAINEGIPPETIGRDNLNTMSMVFGAVEAVETRTYVKLKHREKFLSCDDLN